MRKVTFFLLYFLWVCTAFGQQFMGDGSIEFSSNAPLEIIKANTDKLKGIIDLDQNTFAFSIKINTFKGFNSQLQKEHFNDHYLETATYPKATFVGKIISQDLKGANVDQLIYGKGTFVMHGKEEILTIPCNFIKTGREIQLSSTFQITLADFGIRIPKVLEPKIAPIIDVHMTAVLKESE